MLPAYRGLADRLTGAERHEVAIGDRTAAVIAGRAAGLDLLLVDEPSLYDRDGRPYLGPDGQDWPDNHIRFAHFARVAAAVATGAVANWQPDVVHAHDWQAGLVPVYLRFVEQGGPPSLLTIHNIAFQGVFPPWELGMLGLPAAAMTLDGVEFWGRISFLKGGLALADRVSTVSPTYARELLRPEFGLGMEGLLAHRAADFKGILNGIDTDTWNPATDTALAGPFSAEHPAGKADNRRALAERFGLVPGEGPLFVVISRMTGQKGLDLLLEAIPAILDTGAALAVLGNGEPALEERFTGAAAANPGRIGAIIGYDEGLAHLMQGGGDAILVPSRFEPCGLTQLYGLRYGTLPVAARTGGLADTVIDANEAALRAGVATGILHEPGSIADLSHAIRRTGALYRDEATWTAMRANAMRHPVGWETSAASYVALYREMTR